MVFVSRFVLVRESLKAKGMEKWWVPRSTVCHAIRYTEYCGTLVELVVVFVAVMQGKETVVVVCQDVTMTVLLKERQKMAATMGSTSLSGFVWSAADGIAPTVFYLNMYN